MWAAQTEPMAPEAPWAVGKAMKGWLVTLGLGTAAGAVAVLMMPRDNPARKLAAQAADKVEDAATRMGCKIYDAMNL